MSIPLPSKSQPVLTLHGDVRQQLQLLPEKSVHCIVTSPPYWGLRSYLTEEDPLKQFEIGSEKTYPEYIAVMVEVFTQAWRVLRDDGTLWLNLGDSMATGAGKVSQCPCGGFQGEQFKQHFGKSTEGSAPAMQGLTQPNRMPQPGLKAKDLVGIPWRVAFALQAAGWYLRSDIIWHKVNPMPESVTDRPTKSHEYIFLLTKNERYFYDHDAIKEQSSPDTHARLPGNRSHKAATAYEEGDEKHRTKVGLVAYAEKQRKLAKQGEGIKNNDSFDAAMAVMPPNRNKRSVWTIANKPYKGSHFAVFPPDLIEPCILAGTSAKGCCASCGAPWERILHREKSENVESHRGSTFHKGKTGHAQNALARVSEKPHTTTCETIGWQPTCECKDATEANIQPCIVLDPFGGSGTTGQVALGHGRHAILIELNRDSLPLCPSIARSSKRSMPGVQR